MNINLDLVLQLVQDFRSQLDVWGVNSEALWAVGAVAAVLFILSLRQVGTWYFRVNQVRDEIRELRTQMLALQKMMRATHDYLIVPEPPVIPMKSEELLKVAVAQKEAPKFRLDH